LCTSTFCCYRTQSLFSTIIRWIAPGCRAGYDSKGIINSRIFIWPLGARSPIPVGGGSKKRLTMCRRVLSRSRRLSHTSMDRAVYSGAVSWLSRGVEQSLSLILAFTVQRRMKAGKGRGLQRRRKIAAGDAVRESMPSGKRQIRFPQLPDVARAGVLVSRFLSAPNVFSATGWT